jgi:hypothetical protein
MCRERERGTKMRDERKRVRLGNVFAKFRLKRVAPINILTRGARTEDEPAVNINIRSIENDTASAELHIWPCGVGPESYPESMFYFRHESRVNIRKHTMIM